MEACPKCIGFSGKVDIPTPSQYIDMSRQLKELVQQGTFLVVHADYPLGELRNGMWPDDILQHDFQCTTCGRAFHLFADTYHGRATWRPLPATEP